MRLPQRALVVFALFCSFNLAVEACLPLIIPVVAGAAAGVGLFAAGKHITGKGKGDRPETSAKGCFADNPHKRDMGQLVMAGDNMTHLLCMDLCRQADTKYMGLQNGDECYCSDSYNNFDSQVSNKKCDIRCKGAGPTETNANCGGKLANNVVQIKDLKTAK